MHESVSGSILRYRCYFRDYDPQTCRYIEPNQIEQEGGGNLYGYVGGNPVGSSDTYGLDAIYINYDYYPVSTPVGKLPLGHGAIVAVDLGTGNTRYYEFGRYGEPQGVVRGFPDIKIPNVVMGKGGLSTPESLKDFLSRNFGYDVNITAKYYHNSDYKGTIDFSEKFKRKHLDYNLLNNNCKTFGRAAATAYQEETVYK